VRITGTEPLADPQIKLNYLSKQRDLDVMIEGLRIVRDIYNQPSFKDRWTHEVIPGAQHQSDEETISAARAMSSTVYHLVGTCRMGSDVSAVVDSNPKVSGVDGLRVVDASVMPKITSANTNAATLMIAEKAAAIIRGEVPASQR
jgi:choline dehydrogenase